MGNIDNGEVTMGHLADAWNAFLKLADDHEGFTIHTDDAIDFKNAIHDAQRIVATIYARKTSPQLFK